MNTLTTEQLLAQALGSTSINTEVQQALSNNTPKPSKAIGVNISIITQTKQDATLFLGSAFSIDIGFLEPYQYEKGLPQQNGDTLKAQIFHLSIQRQHEEYSLMQSIAQDMLEKNEREHTLEWDKVDAGKFPFTVATWKNSGMVWHFVNRKVAKQAGEKLTAERVNDVLSQLL